MMQKWAIIPWEIYSVNQQKEETNSSQTGKGEPIEYLPIENLVIGIPKQGQREVRGILQHIQDSSSISWNLRGELIVKGEVIPQTHLTDLLKDSLYSYKRWIPKGITEFYRALADTNLPLGLIRNPERREFLANFKDLRPPGILEGKWINWD